MGEIAELMLDGAMCQWCGEVLGDGDGYPVVCAGCQRQHDVNEFGEDRSTPTESTPIEPRLTRKYECPIEGCNRKLKTPYGVEQHVRMSHATKGDTEL
jgi:hypothetical protein